MSVFRFEFIGLQDGKTAYGHKFAHSADEMTAWLNEQRIIDPIMGLAGLLPEGDLLVSHKACKIIFDQESRERAIRMLRIFNEVAQSGDFIIDTTNKETIHEPQD